MEKGAVEDVGRERVDLVRVGTSILVVLLFEERRLVEEFDTEHGIAGEAGLG